MPETPTACPWCKRIDEKDYRIPAELSTSFCREHKACWLILATFALARCEDYVTKHKWENVRKQTITRALKVRGVLQIMGKHLRIGRD